MRVHKLLLRTHSRNLLLGLAWVALLPFPLHARFLGAVAVAVVFVG